MSAVAETGVLTRTKGGWSRLRVIGHAVLEYARLVAQAQRTWLVGTAIGVAAAWLNVFPGVTIPGWAIAAIMMATIVFVQFQAFQRVREEREAFSRSRAVDAVIDEIAVLRTQETELRNRPVRKGESYEEWKAELVALRSKIHDKLEQGLSRAEAETFHTIGNLKHAAQGGINDEHSLLLAVATRDIDHLAELIHGHTRFND